MTVRNPKGQRHFTKKLHYLQLVKEHIPMFHQIDLTFPFMNKLMLKLREHGTTQKRK